jgi:hypothetical protein
MEAIRSLLTLVMEYATTPMPSLIASTSVPNDSPAGRYSFINNSLSNVVPSHLALSACLSSQSRTNMQTSGCPRRQTTSFLFFFHIISYFRPSSSVRCIITAILAAPRHLLGRLPIDNMPPNHLFNGQSTRYGEEGYRRTTFSPVFPRFSTELPDLRTELWSD